MKCDAVTFTPDARIIGMGAGSWAIHWQFTKEKSGPVGKNVGPDGTTLKALAYTNDSRAVVMGFSDGSLLLQPIAVDKTVFRFAGHRGAVRGIAVAKNNKQMVSAGDDGFLRLWSLETGKLIRVYEGHKGRVTTVRFIGSDRFISAGADGTVRLWSSSSRADAVAAERNEDLRRIAFAFHSYKDQFSRLPMNVAGKDGKLLLSWRVELLPHLGHSELYRKFKRDEPWNGPNNSKLLPLMPPLYNDPGDVKNKTHSVVLAFSGSGTLFDGKPHGIYVPDGTSDTIAAVRVSLKKAVPWTKPSDLDVSSAKKIKEWLGPPPTEAGYPAAFLDGSQRVLPTNLDEKTLLRLIRINDRVPSGFKK